MTVNELTEAIQTTDVETELSDLTEFFDDNGMMVAGGDISHTFIFAQGTISYTRAYRAKPVFSDDDANENDGLEFMPEVEGNGFVCDFDIIDENGRVLPHTEVRSLVRNVRPDFFLFTENDMY